MIERLDDLNKVVNEIKLELAGRKHVDEKVVKIDEKLAGNGKWGFDKLRDWAMAFDADKKDDAKYYRRFSVTLTVTNLVSLAIAAFFWFIKVLPVIEKFQKAGF